MTLQDLEIGQEVQIQIGWGTRSFYSDSKVLNRTPAGILLESFVVNGTVVKVNKKTARAFDFTLYALDPETGHRVSWPNLEIETVERDGNAYYVCSVRGYLRDAKESERRTEDRLPINVRGMAYDNQTNIGQEIWIQDISKSGIAFTAPTSIEFLQINLRLEFEDHINEQSFMMKVPAQIVRTENQGDLALYGCKFLRVTNQMALYVWMKQTTKRDDV